jgi:hypothetical protein
LLHLSQRQGPTGSWPRERHHPNPESGFESWTRLSLSLKALYCLASPLRRRPVAHRFLLAPLAVCTFSRLLQHRFRDLICMSARLLYAALCPGLRMFRESPYSIGKQTCCQQNRGAGLAIDFSAGCECVLHASNVLDACVMITSALHLHRD